MSFSKIAASVVLLTGVTLAPIRAANAQQLLDVKSAAHLKSEYLADLDTVHVKILALANAIPAGKYGWRPAKGVRSVSEVLMHVVSEWDFYGPRSVGGAAPADFGDPKEAIPKLEKVTGKDVILAQLNKSWAHLKAQISEADPAALTGVYKPWNMAFDQAAFGMTGDLHEHLGQLIAYARMNGVTPPWSK